MSNSEREQQHHKAQVQKQILELASAINMTTEHRNSGENVFCLMQGPVNSENFKKIQIIANTLNDAGLISHAGNITLENLNNGLVIENPTIKLDIQIQNNQFEALIKTKDISQINVESLERAVKNAVKILSGVADKQKDTVPEVNIENMPSDPPKRPLPRHYWEEKPPLSLELPKEAKEISQYLKKKTEATFPGSKPEVTYTQTDPNFGKPAFNIIFAYPDGKDRSALSHFKGSLSEVSGTHNISHFRVNKEDSNIGVTLAGNPLVLSGNIMRNEHDKTLLEQYAIHSR